MNALLLVAHGSRRKQSNDEVAHLAEKLKNNCGEQYDIVKPAFLELSDVLIPEGIEQCIAEGATSITVLPYFLNSVCLHPSPTIAHGQEDKNFVRGLPLFLQKDKCEKLESLYRRPEAFDAWFISHRR